MQSTQKIFILVSQQSGIAAVLRRGPTRWFHLMTWNLNTNEFIHGAWIKARIYPNKCDISPDGRYLLYSAHKGSCLGTSYTDSFTVLSELPAFTALALWPQGTTYIGGGCFQDGHQIGIHHLSVMPIHPEHTDTRGFEVAELKRSYHPHADEQLIEGMQWSKAVGNHRIIAVNGYHIYNIENGITSLFRDLTDMHPPAHLLAAKSISALE